MKNLSRISMILLLSFIVTSCSHGLMRGSVAMKISEREAHVCLGDGEVKVGDRVQAYSNNCSLKGAANREQAGTGTCEKVSLGEGTVTSILNSHYSVVNFAQGVKFDEKTFVEKVY